MSGSTIEKALEKRRAQRPGSSQSTAAGDGEVEPYSSDQQVDQQAAQQTHEGGVRSQAQQGESSHSSSRAGSGADRVALGQRQERRDNPDVEVDLARLSSQGIMVPGEFRTELVEEFRLIKRPLLENAFKSRGKTTVERGRMIMLTSAWPGEGKTFCTLNLALSIALEVGRTVLLVDADVARPSVPSVLGIEVDLGLMDVLTDPAVRLPDVMLRTQFPGLTVLPAGRHHRHSTELLASAAMSDLLEEMHARYEDRVIIFDSPPLLASSEPSVLASQMGQVVLIVEAESTAQAAVTRATHLLAGCDVVLTLLNKASQMGSGGYGGYRGYGGYGGYGSYGGNSHFGTRTQDGQLGAAVPPRPPSPQAGGTVG